ncbi:hypothetical protein BJX64DRAFT_245955 [Aspergillus heterothallicus]
MSADLFAEFGYGPSTSQPLRTPNQQAVASQTGSSSIPDFNPLDHPSTPQFSYPLNEPAALHTRQWTAINNATPVDNDFGDFEPPQHDNGNEVLFDAMLDSFPDDGSDDWGEFETAEASPDQPHTIPSIKKQKYISTPASKIVQRSEPSRGTQEIPNLLDSFDTFALDDKAHASTNRKTTRMILVDDDGLTLGSGPLQSQPSRPTLPVEEEPFEEWGDFTDGPMGATQPSFSKTSIQQTTMASRESGEPPASHVRPTNIPPPSILLEIFPQLFERLRQKGAEAKKNVRQKEGLDAVALSILCTLKVVARVVAGRTLRWKRDTILSQSMRIGPARSGKTGGMKLSTVNKNEDIKEQQEAVDVVKMWRDRAALFNSVIQAAGKRPVQVILENTRVTTVTAGQGAIKASHACALCGLRRDERIPKVDENVEDSFGEWWTEHWGHTDCRLFWKDNMGLLGQR